MRCPTLTPIMSLSAMLVLKHGLKIRKNLPIVLHTRHELEYFLSTYKFRQFCYLHGGTHPSIVLFHVGVSALDIPDIRDCWGKDSRECGRGFYAVPNLYAVARMWPNHSNPRVLGTTDVVSCYTSDVWLPIHPGRSEIIQEVGGQVCIKDKSCLHYIGCFNRQSRVRESIIDELGLIPVALYDFYKKE